MDVIGLSLLGALGLYASYVTWTHTPVTEPQRPPSLWGQQVGKTHAIQSMHGDASMSTERVRRRVIQSSGRLNKSAIKETKTLLGSTTGAIETFMISGICPPLCIPKCPTDIIFDGGDETSIFCPIPGTTDYDAGNDNTKVCGV